MKVKDLLEDIENNKKLYNIEDIGELEVEVYISSSDVTYKGYISVWTNADFNDDEEPHTLILSV